MIERTCKICGQSLDSALDADLFGIRFRPTVHADCADRELANLHIGPRAMGQGGKVELQKQIRDWDKC